MEGFRKRRFDGIYADRILLIWDSWRNSRWRKPILALAIALALVVSQVGPTAPKIQITKAANLDFTASRGSANNKTSGTTLNLTPTGTIPAGELAVVRAVSDNLQTTDGTSTDHTVSDSKSNAWTKIREHTFGGGAAAAGVTVSLWYSRVTSSITTSDTVTLTISSAVTAKAMSLDEYDLESGYTVSLAGANGNQGTGTAPTVSLSSLASKQYLWLGAVGIEGPGDDHFVQDTDYSSPNGNNIGTTGGTNNTNVGVRGGYRKFTGTSDTFDPPYIANSDLKLIGTGAAGTDAAPAATISIPTHQSGDLIVIGAWKNNTTAPSLPSGWTSISTGSANGTSNRIGYRVATSSSETSGTWTGATHMTVYVFRGQHATPIGGNGGSSNVNGSVIRYSALTMAVTDGSSWIIGTGGRLGTITDITATTGGKLNTHHASSERVQALSTFGGVTAFSSDEDATVGSGTARGRGGSVEIRGANVASRDWAAVIGALEAVVVQSITGTAYNDEATTVWTGCDGSTARLSLVINGGTAATTSCSSSTGAFDFGTVSFSSGDPISVFFNTAGGNTDKGVAVTVAGSGAGIVLNPRKNVIWLKTETGVSNITNTNLNHCDSDAPAQCANVPYAVSGGNLTAETETKIRIESGKTYAPGGNVTTPKLHIQGTYTGASETLTLTGSGTGTARPLFIDSGTFTASSNTTRFTGDGDSDIQHTTYNILILEPTITANRAYTFTTGSLTTAEFDVFPSSTSSNTLSVNLGGNLSIGSAGIIRLNGLGAGPAVAKLDTTASNYSISAGQLFVDSSSIFEANGSTITLNNTSAANNLISRFGGQFNAGTSTVVMNPNASKDGLFAGDFTGSSALHNLTLSPTISSSSKTYTMCTDNSPMEINGNFNINPSAASALSLTVNMCANITVASTKTTTITRTSSATSVLKTRPSSTDYNLTTGLLNIAAGGTLDAGGSSSVITLNGTSGTLFTRNGTFTQGTSEVLVTGAGYYITLLSHPTTFHKLTINPGSDKIVSAGSAITMSSADAANKLYIQSGTLDDNGAQITGTANGTLEMAANTTLKLGSATAATTFPTNYTNGNITLDSTSTVTYQANADQTISSTPTYANLKISPPISASHTDSVDGALTVNGDLGITPTLNGTQAIYSIIHDGTNYVAAGYDDSADSRGDAVIWESTNRTSWTKRVVDGTAGSFQAIYSIIFDGTNYVAAGYDNSADSRGDAVIWESTNRTSWTKRVVDGTAGSFQAIYSIIFDGTNYVAAGLDYSAGSYDAVIWESTNRTSWTRRVVDGTAGSTQVIFSIIHDGTNYVAAGLDYSADANGDAVIWESTNRTSWTKRVVDGTAGSYQFISSIIHDGTNYVAAGYDNSAGSGDAVIWESTNRTSWTKRVVDGTAGSYQYIYSIIHDGTNYVAAGEDDSADSSSDAVIWESTNRTSWTKRVVDGTAGSYQFISSIIHDGTNYVAAGYDNSAGSGDAVIWESTNRTSWRGQGLGDTSLVLTLNLGGNIAVASGKTATIGYGSVSLVVDTMPVATPYNLSTGNLTIKPYATLDSTSATSAINVAGNYTNNGTFTAGSSTVTLNGTSTQTLSGTMTGSSSFYNLTITNNSGASATSCERDGFTASVDFNAAATVSNNFTITTANVRIEYNSGSTYTFTNINWNGQAAGTRIFFRNSAASGTWLLNVSGTQTAVSYVNVSRSDASGGDTINAADGTNVDCGNNDNWNFTVTASTFEQAAYRFGFSNGTNTDIVYTGAPSQDTPLTIDNTGDNFRLRLLIHVGGSDLSVNGNHFKLQFGEKTAATCASGVSWSDVGTGAGVIRYYNDSAGSDGDAISNVTGDPSHSGHTRRYQTYEEANNFTNSQAAIAAGEDGVWDFSLINHSAVGGKKYCFRVFDVTGNDVLDSYSVYPEIAVNEELIFTLDATSKNFGVVQPGDNPTERTSTVTVSTNSSTGYIVYAWATQKMTLTNGFGTFEIPDWTGSNATPTAWPDGSFGFGYTTDDGDLTGGTANRFTDGGPKFAAFVNTGPGDPVADRSSGPVSSAANNITYRLAAGTGQQAGTYNTIIVYVVSVTF